MLEIGVAERALDGSHSGDRAVIAEHERTTLLAAIDGLGHGPEAAEAAAAAAAVLERAPTAPFSSLFERCHEALSRTRGAVLTLARFDESGTLEWAGIGNVEARLMRPGSAPGSSESPVLLGGVLGHSFRPARTSTIGVGRGDVLIMVTDGVSADFSTGLFATGAAQALADRILAASGKAHDDALVVVARWLGPRE